MTKNQREDDLRKAGVVRESNAAARSNRKRQEVCPLAHKNVTSTLVRQKPDCDGKLKWMHSSLSLSALACVTKTDPI